MTSTVASTSSRQYVSAVHLNTARPPPPQQQQQQQPSSSTLAPRTGPYPYSGMTSSGNGQVSAYTGTGRAPSFRPPRVPPSSTPSFRMPRSALPSTAGDGRQRSSDAVTAGLAYLRGAAHQVPVPQQPPTHPFGAYGVGAFNKSVHMLRVI